MGPASTQRQVGFPHRLVVIVSEPSRKGPSVRSRARMRWPIELVRAVRGIWKVSILSTLKARKIQHVRLPSDREGFLGALEAENCGISADRARDPMITASAK